MSVVQEVALRSGTTTEWAAADAPILGVGEVGLDVTTGELRVGDGTTPFASLRDAGRGKVGKATLVTGAKVVSDPRITATAVVLLTAQSLGTVTAPKTLAVTARTPGTSFTITSADATDTSVVGYEIIEP